MSGSHFERLNWAYPDSPATRGGTRDSTEAPMNAGAPRARNLRGVTAESAGASADTRSPMVRALDQIGLPIGSTELARSSPLLEARDLLRAAAEIEHGLLVQYLYAAYSCTKPAIRGVLAKIAKQEMGHLICVQNLLLAIGGTPYFGREHFPTSPGTDKVFPFALTFEPISLESLAKYVVAESPPLESITDSGLKARVKPIIGVGKVSAQQAINHVGALYLALYWLFKADDSKPGKSEWKDYPRDWVLAVHKNQNPKRSNWHLRSEDFAKQPDIEDVQADPNLEDWNRGDESIFVRSVKFLAGSAVDRAPILETIFDIADQGEGWQPPTSQPAPPAEPREPSHFQRFLETYEAVASMPAGGPPLALNVPINPNTVEPTASGFIANREANLWGQIFNVRYRTAMLKLALAIASRKSIDPGTEIGRAHLIGDSLGEMKNNLKVIALELVKMRREEETPASPKPTDRPSKAAPPFEFPAGSLPNLVGLDPDPKIAEAKTLKLLRRALRDALEDTRDLVNRVNGLPVNLQDPPSNRQVLNDIVTSDAALMAALA